MKTQHCQSSTENRARRSRLGRLDRADILSHGLAEALGFRHRGQELHDRIARSVRLEHSSPAIDVTGFGSEGTSMSSRFQIPNKRVERTAASRLGCDVSRFLNIIGHILSALSAAVAHSWRYAKRA